MPSRTAVFAALFLAALTAYVILRPTPSSVRTITPTEMLQKIPEFDFSQPWVKLDPALQKAVDQASADAKADGYSCYFSFVGSCEKSQCLVAVYTLTGISDTHLVYRISKKDLALLDKCQMDVWYPGRLGFSSN